MKQMIITLCLFGFGVFIGHFWLGTSHISMLLTPLVLLSIFLAGFEIGGDRSHLQQVHQHSVGVLYLPLLVVLGALAGGALSALILSSISLHQCLLLALGLGYYSLSGSLITAHYGSQLGTIALLCDILRETITLLIAPLLFRYGGGASIIASAAATAMDNCLPMIRKVAGVDWVYPAFVSGFIANTCRSDIV